MALEIREAEQKQSQEQKQQQNPRRRYPLDLQLLWENHHSIQQQQKDDSFKNKNPNQDTSENFDTTTKTTTTNEESSTTFFQTTWIDVMDKIVHDHFIVRPPRDWWEGFWDAITNIQRGCWGAVCNLVDSGWDGYAMAGLPGLLSGGIYGILQGVLLTTGGIALGLYQLLQGVTHTPTARQESRNGKSYQNGKWIYYSLDGEDRDIEVALAQSSTDFNQRSRQLRQRSYRKVKEKEFYMRLKVSTDASQEEIKRAYYREALRAHPDKNTEDRAEANERFQKLSEAYRILSHPESREAYDRMGKCSLETEMAQLDSYTFFAVMFGSVLVEPYVGELKIASLVDSFLNLKDTTTTFHTQKAKYSPTSKEWNNASDLKQRRRELDIALQLRNRLAKFVAGIQSETQFRAACRLEATSIAKSEFGDSFLLSIGRTLVLQGKQYVGTHTPSKFGLERASIRLQAKSVDVMEGYQTLVALFQSVASSLGPLLEAFLSESQKSFSNDESTNFDSPSSSTCGSSSSQQQQQSRNVDTTVRLMEKLEGTIPKALRLVWQLNDRDIRQTLQEASNALLQDGPSQEIRIRRAQGLILLGEEFYQVGLEEKRKDRWKDFDTLKNSIMSAFAAAVQGP